MSEQKCHKCEKPFNSADALAMHNNSKHPEAYKKPLFTSKQKKSIRNWVIVIGIVGLLVWGVITLSSKDGSSSSSLNVDLSPEQAQQIPPGNIHWHPILTILIDGKQTTIPPDLGYGTGKIVDTHLSGMRMSPIHTHDSGGTLHMENNNPSSKPETVTLGYVFYVWGKTFNSTCIFEYCTDKGTLTMTVNGKQNIEFGNYIMRDKDQIKIEYESFRGEN